MLEQEIRLNKRELEIKQRAISLQERELELLRKRSGRRPSPLVSDSPSASPSATASLSASPPAAPSMVTRPVDTSSAAPQPVLEEAAAASVAPLESQVHFVFMQPLSTHSARARISLRTRIHAQHIQHTPYIRTHTLARTPFACASFLNVGVSGCARACGIRTDLSGLSSAAAIQPPRPADVRPPLEPHARQHFH